MESVNADRDKLHGRFFFVVVYLLYSLIYTRVVAGATYEIYPATVESQEEFETVASGLQPGDELIFNCEMTGITAAPHVAVPYVRNVRIVNNTIVNHPKGVLIRWGDASDMVFANNAVYCPGTTATDASGIGNSVASANYIEGRLMGVTVDGSRFTDGGMISSVFTDPFKNNYWPRPDSVFIGHADPKFAPRLDFNGTARKPPFDVGAYESEGNTSNPGPPVQAGFKTND